MSACIDNITEISKNIGSSEHFGYLNTTTTSATPNDFREYWAGPVGYAFYNGVKKTVYKHIIHADRVSVAAATTKYHVLAESHLPSKIIAVDIKMNYYNNADPAESIVCGRRFPTDRMEYDAKNRRIGIHNINSSSAVWYNIDFELFYIEG